MNLYISNLSFGISDADLNQLFSEYGEVSSAKVITDRETGRSRGFGFVEMSNDEEAEKAITVRLLQQKLLWIEKLAVQEASVSLS